MIFLNKGYSIEEVRKIIEEQSDCKLLSTEYINTRGKLLLKCGCGNNFSITFCGFLKSPSKRCGKCITKVSPKRMSLKDMFEYINTKTNLLFLGFPNGYKGTTSKLKLQCECGDSFITTVGKMLYREKHQCNECGKEKAKKNFKQTVKLKNHDKNIIKEKQKEERINKKRESKKSLAINSIITYINDNTNLLFLGFPDGYSNKTSRIELGCICGETFKTAIKTLLHKNKHQCNTCGRKHKKVTYNKISRKLSYEKLKERIESKTRFKLLDYDENTGYFDLECSCGHIINTTLRKLGRVTQCRECSNEKLRHERRKTISEIIECINTNTDCLFLEFPEGYKNQNSKIKLQCICGEVFTTKVVKLFGRNKYQCNDCGDKISSEKKLTDIQEVKELIYNNSNSKFLKRVKGKRRSYRLVLECQCGEVYTASLPKFREGFGRSCPECTKSMSNGEVEVKKHLEDMGLDFEQERYVRYKEQGMFIDFVITKDNIIKYAIEFDGKQHFKPIDFFGGIEGFEQRIIRDRLKDEYCKVSNIPLLRIPYTEFHNIKEIVSDFHSRFFNA